MIEDEGMRLFEINRNPSVRQLRQFGLTLAFVILVVGWLLNFRAGGLAMSIATATAIAACAMVRPKSMKAFFIGMTLAAAPLGMIVGELAMLLLFYGVFLPIGTIFRLIGRDALNRRIDTNASTYWQTTRKAGDASHYFRRY